MKMLCFALAISFSWLGAASEIPRPLLPAGVGVNIHFVTGHEKDLDLIAVAGFKFIRMDFGWESTETKKGAYDWSGYDELLANLDQRKMGAVLILDYSHHFYEEAVTSTHPITHEQHQTTASPQHPESIAAYARWAAAAAKHYRGRHIIWEIWNEPNIQFWSPKPDVQQYVSLTLAACKAIRQAEPSATIVGPATSGFPWDFLEKLFEAGTLDYLDAVSVHPYRNARNPPETATQDYEILRHIIDRFPRDSEKGKIPILSGEWGYSSWSKGVSLEAQAAYAARQQLVNLLNNVPLSIWYDWKNDGEDPNENEHNFGMVTPDLSAKPAYTSLRTLTRELSGYHLAKRMPLDAEKDYLLLFENAEGQHKLAAWTLIEPHTITLLLDSNDLRKVAIVNHQGETSTTQTEHGELVLELDTAPRYVTLGSVSIKL